MQIIRNRFEDPGAAGPGEGPAMAAGLGQAIAGIVNAARNAKAKQAAEERDRASYQLDTDYKRAQIEKLRNEPGMDAAKQLEHRHQQDIENDFKRQDLALRGRERTDKRAEKKQMALDEVAVPGYELQGDVMPQKTEAVKLREALGQKNALTENLAAYKAMVAQHGTTEFTGPASEQMASLATSIKMNLKNLYDLGAITGPDMAILGSQVPDPTSMKSLFTKDASQQAGLDALGNNLTKGFETRMKGAGYRQQAPAAKRYKILSVEE